VAGFKVDPKKLAGHVTGSLRKAGRVVDRVVTPIDAADEAVNAFLDEADRVVFSPIAYPRAKACTIPCAAQVVGLADVPDVSYREHASMEVALFRLTVERPDGAVEVCVRDHVPLELRRSLIPGLRIRVLAHESERAYAIVDWPATSKDFGIDRPTLSRGCDTYAQYDWPDVGEWPAPGAIEVRDNWRHRRRFAERRATWTPMTARLVSATATGGELGSRGQWKLELALPNGGVARVKERVPNLAVARIVGYRARDLLGGRVKKIETVVRPNTPIAVLVSPTFAVAVDWEATIRFPELWSPDAVGDA
jgi:hypothetical protein